MSITVKQLMIEQKARHLGIPYESETSMDKLLASIRKIEKDFLKDYEALTPLLRKRRLVRVSLRCLNPARLERKSEQLFTIIDGQRYGMTMFYREMADAWHFEEAFLDYLLGMEHFTLVEEPFQGSTDGTTNAPKVVGTAPDFEVTLLAPLDQAGLDRIAKRQAAQGK